MRRFFAFFPAVVVLSVGAALSGCGGSEETVVRGDTGSTGAAGGDVSGKIEAPKDAKKGAWTAKKKEPATAPPRRPGAVFRPTGGDVRDRGDRDAAAERESRRLEPGEEDLRKISKELARDREQETHLINFYLEHARRMWMQGQTVDALQDVNRIVELRPGHPDATKLRDEIMAAEGDVEGEYRSLYQSALSVQRITRDKARVEAQAEYKQGTEDFNEERFDAAIKHFERAVEIITFSSMELDLNSVLDAARDAITEANARKLASVREQERQARELATRVALLERQKDLDRARNKIHFLLLSAQENVSAQRWDKARSDLGEVLSLDPKNTIAKEMLDDIRYAELRRDKDSYLRRRVEQWRRDLQEWDRVMVPETYENRVQYPDATYWEKVSKRVAALRRFDSKRESTDVKTVKSILDTRKIKMDFDKAKFSEVVDYVASTIQINIVVDRPVRERMDSQEVSFIADNLKARDALTILLGMYNLDMEFKERVLVIVEKGHVSSEAVLQLHDVRDIVRPTTNFAAGKINPPAAAPGGGGGPPMFTEPVPETQVIDIEQITTLITESIKKETWANAPFAIKDTPDKQLLVYHTPETQREVADLLDSLRKNSGLLVSVESKFVTVSDDFLEVFGLDFRGLGGQKGINAPLEDVRIGPEDFAGGGFDNTGATSSPSSGVFFNDNTDGDIRARTENIFDNPLGNLLTPVGGATFQMVYLDDTEVSMIITGIRKTRRATLLTAPNLTVFNTQRAHITVVNQVAYVRDFDVQVAQGVAVADPIIDVVQDGLALDVKPTVSNDRKYVTLELRPTVADLLRPIPTFTTNLGGPVAAPVTIQIPEISMMSAQTTVKLPDGGTVLIGGLRNVRDVTRRSEIPWFGNLPILGLLFRSQGQDFERKNLIILVKAKIVDLKEQEDLFR